ncbi:MAG: hypothetical protein ACYSVY_25845 [Planctomycetota bacterium]|jgi:hypothetical protein
MQRSLIAGPVLAALIAGSLTAQTASMTLPKGWDTKEGIQLGSTTAPSQFFVGFDLGPTSTATYNPAKAMFLYEANDFPWDKTKAKVITKLSFRRDGEAATYTAHKREWVVIMSTSSIVPARANFNLYNGNHGTNRTVVFGSIGTPRAVTFTATAAPKPPATAPFDVNVKLDKAFLVPANSKTLVIEIRSYKVTGATSGRWRADAVTYSPSYVGSTFGLINTGNCVTPAIFWHSRGNNIGSNFLHVFVTCNRLVSCNRSWSGGQPFIAWVGPRNPKANLFKFPGTNCNVHVFPVLYAVYGTTGKSGGYAMMMDYGTIPNNTVFKNVTVNGQGIIADSRYPGGAGLTRAFTYTIGTAFDPNFTKGSQMNSYGANTIMYHGTSPTALRVNPDKEKYAFRFFNRHVIVKIN